MERLSRRSKGDLHEARPRGQRMAVDPEAFDVPVVDYDFSKATTPRALIDQMAQAGGFTATKFAEARSILADMRSIIDAADADPAKGDQLALLSCLSVRDRNPWFLR